MGKEVKKITASSIISWIVGFFLLLAGFGSLAQGSVSSGIFIILLSLPVIPYFDKMLEEKVHVKITRGVKVLLVIVIFVIIMVSSTKELGETKNTIVKPSGQVETKIQPEVKTEEVKEEPEEGTKFYGMNEDIKVDYLTYKVTKAETFTEMGTSMIKKEADGKYIKVYLEITNNAKETKQVFTPRFTLVDEKGRQYSRLYDDILYISDALELGKQLQPGVTAKGAIVFEVAKDAQGAGLVIRGDWLSVSEVGVIISKIYDIGKDTTLKDEVDEAMDEAMEEAEEKVEEMMNKCNSPFVCTSSCPEYMDVGQKNCPSGHLCCMQT